MVNRRYPSPTLEVTKCNSDVEVQAEMRAAKEELRRHNQTLEDDVHNIGQRQLEFNPSEEIELLDP